MGVVRQWRLPRWTEVRELHHGPRGRIVLAWPAPVPERRRDTALAGDGWGAGGALGGAGAEEVRPVVVRYVPARLLVHRARATAFRADVDRLAGLLLPEVAVPYKYVQAPAFRAAYERSSVAVGGALVSDAAEGAPLARLLERREALSASAAAALFRGVLRALVAVHDRRTAHGDLRAAKVMVRVDGGVTVTGLGLAALGTGAPEARAPEVWRGPGLATAASDVYAAGCLLHLCLTGHQPFPTRNLFRLMAGHTTGPVPLDGIPAPLRELLAAGLTKDPERRPRAAFLLAEAERSAALDREEQGRSELGALAAPLVRRLPSSPPAASAFPRWPVGSGGRTRSPHRPRPRTPSARRHAPKF